MPQHAPEASFPLWLLAQAQRDGTALAILGDSARLTRVAALAEAMAVNTDRGAAAAEAIQVALTVAGSMVHVVQLLETLAYNKGQGVHSA